MEADAKPLVSARGEPDPESVLLQTVRAYRTQLTARILRGRLAILLAGISVVPLGLVVADHLWPGGLARWLLTGARLGWLAAGVSGILVMVLITLGRPLGLAFVARRIERIRQIDHNSLVNAILLRSRGPLAYAEPAVVQQAVRALATHEPSAALELRERPTHWLALLVALAAWVGYAVLGPKPIGPSLARLFGADRAAPSATWLELVRPGAGDAPHAGQPLEVEVALHGRGVREARFAVLEPSTGAVRSEYVATESVGGTGDHRRFVLPPYEVQGDLTYRCVAGDGRLEGRIRIEPQPVVESLRIVLEPPVSAGRSPYEADGPDLAVVAGTRATFTLTANAVLSEPVFVFRGVRETRTRMRVDAERPQVAQLVLLLAESGTYHVEFSDSWAVPYRDPPEYRIDVRADAPPQVTLAVPEEADTPDGVVEVERWEELVAQAADDLALTEFALVVERGNGTIRQNLLPADAAVLTEATGRAVTARLVEPGQTVRVWFEVADGRTLADGRVAPQRARSRAVTLVRAADSDDAPPREAPRRSNENQQRKPGTGEAGGDEGERSQPGEPAKHGGVKGADGGASADKPDSGTMSDGAQGATENTTPEGAQEETTPKPGAGDSRQPNGASRPETPQPDSSGTAQPAGESAAQEAEDEVRGFVKEHGQEAREAGRAGRGQTANPGDAEQPAEGKEAEPVTSRPAAMPQPTEPQGATSQPAESQPGDSSPSSGAGVPEPTGGQAGAKSSTPANGRGDKADDAADSQQEPQPGAGDPTEPNSAAAGAKPGGDGRPDGTTPGPDDATPPSDESAEPVPAPADGEVAPLESDGLAETLDLLGMMERGEPLTEDVLVEAGWPREKAARFVRALERLHAAVQAAGGVGALHHERFDTRVGSAERVTGADTSDAGRRGRDPQAGPGGAQRRIAPPAEQRGPASLQELLEAYYRSLAQKRARTGE